MLFPKAETNLKLLVRYWCIEWGKRSFKIYIDDVFLITKSIMGKWNCNEFVNVEYLLPENILKKKSGGAENCT